MKKIVLLCMTISLMLSISCAATFSDLAGNWAKTDIEKAVELKLVSGYPDGTFKPSNNITRIEFMIITNKILAKVTPIMEMDEEDVYQFADLSEASWAQMNYNQFMTRVNMYNSLSDYNYGAKEIMNIFGEKLEPNKPITREEAIAIISLFINESDTVDLPNKFTDIGSSKFPNAIRIANKVGITNGYPDGTFKPFNKITRAEATKMLLTLDEMKYQLKSVRTFKDSNKYTSYLEPVDVMKKILFYESFQEFVNGFDFYNPQEIEDLDLTSLDYTRNKFLHAYINTDNMNHNKFEVYEERISNIESVVYYKDLKTNYLFSKKFTNIDGKWYASFETSISL